jgi:hypothetical protein
VRRFLDIVRGDRAMNVVLRITRTQSGRRRIGTATTAL